jgi:hypothetical protein
MREAHLKGEVAVAGKPKAFKPAKAGGGSKREKS